mmetsp:Transcript_313/g.311  ORF Transcript_313/g.311 Transcript_313/m.311 type:complete len:88 (+) Transcript_313:607-870(+)
MFHVVVTHEARSSVSNEVGAPFTRINDGSMYIIGVKESTRIEAFNYLNRISEGTHCTYDRFFYQKATELKFKNPKGSYFCVDGEPFQ